MRRFNLFLTTLLTVLAVGCASAISVKTDRDRSQRIPEVKTFAWMMQPAMPVRNPHIQNSLMDTRIKRAVDRELDALGYVKSEGDPALLVVYYIGLEDKIIDTTPYGYGYGGYYGRGYGGGGSHLQTYKEGTLILDFVDPATKQLIWRGWAVGALDDPEKAAMYVNKAVSKILDKFSLQDDEASA